MYHTMTKTSRNISSVWQIHERTIQRDSVSLSPSKLNEMGGDLSSAGDEKRVTEGEFDEQLT